MDGKQAPLAYVELFLLVNAPFVKATFAQGVALGFVFVALLFRARFKRKDICHDYCRLRTRAAARTGPTQ